MSEETPKIEVPEKKEITEQEVAEVLRTKGIENPEAKRLLLAWNEQEEKKVASRPDYSLAVIEANRRKARLYLAAGYEDEALESMEAALYQARNEGRGELVTEILNELSAEQNPGGR